jgi:GT2 family glycosyltransferase
MPTVSVLMTAYNREQYVRSSIESVLNQRFRDFELVVVDDHSSDRTVDIARELAAGDARVRVIVNERNLGDYANRNRAAALARGRFLKYHDSDDLMYPHCLETMVSALTAESRAAFALSTAWAWPGGPVPMLLSPRQCYQREFLGFGLFMCGPSCALFRTDVFRALGGFPEIGAHADHVFWLTACARHSVLLISADLFWYRSHPQQEFHSARAAKDYAEVPGHVWQALFSDGCVLEGEELEQARRNQAWTVAKQLWRDLRAGRWTIARHRLQHCGLGAADWLKYLRRARRSPLAGTPLDADGEYLVPEWLQVPRQRSVRSG